MLAIVVLGDPTAKILADRHFFKNVEIFIIFFEVSGNFRVPEEVCSSKFDAYKPVFTGLSPDSPDLVKKVLTLLA